MFRRYKRKKNTFIKGCHIKPSRDIYLIGCWTDTVYFCNTCEGVGHQTDTVKGTLCPNCGSMVSFTGDLSRWDGEHWILFKD